MSSSAFGDEAGERTIEVISRLDGPVELDYYRQGGILPAVLRRLANSEVGRGGERLDQSGSPTSAARAGSALLLLVAANLIPVVGVLFFEWDVGLILLTYWVENGIVGILNVPRILLASGGEQPASAGAGKALLAAFFVVHYGIFWFVHGVFLNVFLNLRGLFTTSFNGFGAFDPFGVLVADSTVLIAGLALFLSHLANLIVNYLGRGEYKTSYPGAQMFAPYPRMIALHVTIIVGGMAIVGLGQPLFAVLLLVVIKTMIDIGLYRFDRERFGRALNARARSGGPPEPAVFV